MDLQRYESEVDRDNKKEILDQVAKNLPVQCRTVTGGQFSLFMSVIRVL